MAKASVKKGIKSHPQMREEILYNFDKFISNIEDGKDESTEYLYFMEFMDNFVLNRPTY